MVECKAALTGRLAMSLCSPHDYDAHIAVQHLMAFNFGPALFMADRSVYG